MIQIQKINNIKVHPDFFSLSKRFGYTSDLILEYQKEIEDLVKLWNTNKQVEIYTEDSERAWGRIKESSGKNAKTPIPGAIPYYIDLFHTRVTKTGNDPLLLLTFKDGDLIIRMFTDHDDLFGSKHMKGDREALKRMKKNLSKMIFDE